MLFLKLSIEEVEKRMKDPAMHYGQYCKVFEGEELPCNCELISIGFTQHFEKIEWKWVCKFCGRKYNENPFRFCNEQ